MVKSGTKKKEEEGRKDGLLHYLTAMDSFRVHTGFHMLSLNESLKLNNLSFVCLPLAPHILQSSPKRLESRGGRPKSWDPCYQPARSWMDFQAPGFGLTKMWSLQPFIKN